MRCRLRLLIALISLFSPPAIAYHVDNHLPVVIDTDMGLDDAVTLAMALQNPGTYVMAIVLCEGAAGRTKGVENLVRLLHLVNRKDIPIYAPAGAEASTAVRSWAGSYGAGQVTGPDVSATPTRG